MLGSAMPVSGEAPSASHKRKRSVDSNLDSSSEEEEVKALKPHKKAKKSATSKPSSPTKGKRKRSDDSNLDDSSSAEESQPDVSATHKRTKLSKASP